MHACPGVPEHCSGPSVLLASPAYGLRESYIDCWDSTAQVADTLIARCELPAMQLWRWAGLSGDAFCSVPVTKNLLIRCPTCSVLHALSMCRGAPAALELDADRAELFRGASAARSAAKGNSVAPRSAADIKAAYGRNNSKCAVCEVACKSVQNMISWLRAGHNGAWVGLVHMLSVGAGKPAAQCVCDVT